MEGSDFGGGGKEEGVMGDGVLLGRGREWDGCRVGCGSGAGS